METFILYLILPIGLLTIIGIFGELYELDARAVRRLVIE
jgi:hypothetical protein